MLTIYPLSVTAAGLSLIVVGGFIAAIATGGYWQSLSQKPWAEPLRWPIEPGPKRDAELAKFRARNQRFRPRLLTAMILGSAAVAAGVVILVTT